MSTHTRMGKEGGGGGYTARDYQMESCKQIFRNGRKFNDENINQKMMIILYTFQMLK